MIHKFNLDQVVVFTPCAWEVLEVPTRGRITRHLPKEGDDFHYLVQIKVNGPDRRVRESQLQAL